MNVFSKKNAWTGNNLRRKSRKFSTNIFFDLHWKRNRFVYIKNCKSNKKILEIFIQKWVQVYFRETDKYDKTLYLENDIFWAHKSIYIWNLLLKSFPTVCRMIRNVTFNRSYWWMFFPKKMPERVITWEGKVENFQQIFFLTYTEKGIVLCI